MRYIVKRKKVTLICICLMILLVLGACAKKPEELNGFKAVQILIYYDYDEKAVQDNKYTYRFDLLENLKNSTIKGRCEFSYYYQKEAEQPEYEWTVDADGTKRLHQISGGNSFSGFVTNEYDISVFNAILDLIEDGASVYTGPGSDGQGKLVYTKLPLLIELNGLDKDGYTKTIYINNINKQDALTKKIEELKS